MLTVDLKQQHNNNNDLAIKYCRKLRKIKTQSELSRNCTTFYTRYKLFRQFSLPAEIVHHVWLPLRPSANSRFLPRRPSAKIASFQDCPRDSTSCRGYPRHSTSCRDYLHNFASCREKRNHVNSLGRKLFITHTCPSTGNKR